MKRAKAKHAQRMESERKGQRSALPKKILVPIDFSETSLEAFNYALEYARELGAELIVLHVVEPAPFIADLGNVPLAMSDQEMAQAAQTKLNRLVASDRKLSPPIKKLVRIGRAYQEIVDAAKEQRAELITIATHGYTGLKHTLLGSTTERVVRHAPCPVLVVRKPQR